MKVKVGNKVYSGDDEPVMVILSKDDQENITNMSMDNAKYCAYPVRPNGIDGPTASGIEFDWSTIEMDSDHPILKYQTGVL